MPERIQLSRKRGCRLPAGAKSVARPSTWGNPFRVGSEVANHDHDPPVPCTGLPAAEMTPPVRTVRDRADAVALFIRWVPYVRDNDSGLTYAQLARRDLAGLDLACWCPPGEPCHADQLLALAAGRRMTTPNRTLPDGSTDMTVKRCCNGCGDELGDITDEEFSCAVNGWTLPDVRRECPYCTAILTNGPFLSGGEALTWLRATAREEIAKRGAPLSADAAAQRIEPWKLHAYLVRYFGPGMPGATPAVQARLVAAAVHLGLPIPKETTDA